MQSMATPPRSTVHLDAEQMRALAHPLRMRLLASLRVAGPATATDLAQRLNSNTGKTSYHLRRLEAVGLVLEDTERGNARDRWWRAAHTGTTWSSADFLDDPDTNVAAEWLTGHVARTHARWLNEYVEARSEFSPQWLEAAAMSDYRVTLTPERLREMNDELHAVVERYRDDEPTADAEQVTVLLHAFPHPEPIL